MPRPEPLAEERDNELDDEDADERDIAPGDEELPDVQTRHDERDVTQPYLQRDTTTRDEHRDAQARHHEREVTQQNLQRDTTTRDEQRDNTTGTAEPAAHTIGERHPNDANLRPERSQDPAEDQESAGDDVPHDREQTDRQRQAAKRILEASGEAPARAH